MCEATDERIDADDVEISAQHIVVNNRDAWTPQDVRDNVLWTKVGAMASVCAVVFSLVAIIIAFTQ